MEYIELIDVNGNKIGKTVERGTALKEGENYLASVVVLKNNEEYIITKRHPDKSAGNKWEFPGGGVSAGETSIEAAIRELKEETGIDAKTDELEFLDRFHSSEKHLIFDVFLLEKEIDINSMVLQESEVVDAKKVSFEEIKNMSDEVTTINRIIVDIMESKLY